MICIFYIIRQEKTFKLQRDYVLHAKNMDEKN